MFSIKADQQLTSTDSGVSTIKMVYDIYGKPISREYIAQQTPQSKKGIDFKEIQTFFEENEFTTKFEVFSLSDLNIFKTELPFIVPVKSKKAYEYLVVTAIKKNKLKVSNSKTGAQYYVSIDEFRDLFKLSKSETDTSGIEKRIYHFCKNTISKYHIDLHVFLQENSIANLANKVTYFNYINEKFGFKSTLAEKGFLEEILKDVNFKVPLQFQGFYEKSDQLHSKIPLILIPKPSKEVTVDKNPASGKNAMYWELFKQLQEQKNMWYVYVFITLFSAIIAQLSVFIHQILIDHILPTFNISKLILFAIGLSFYNFFDLFTTVYKKFVGIHLKNSLDLFFLKEFDSKMNRFSLSYIQSYQKGDLLERVSDALKLKRFFTKFFITILIDLVISIYSLLILFYLNWKLTLVILFTTILFYLWFKTITPYLKQNEKIRYTRKANYLSKIIEKIEGIQVLKSFGNEAYYSHKIMSAANSYLKIQLKNEYVNLINTTVVSLLMMVITTIVILALAKSAILYQAVTLGQIVTFISLSSKIFGSLKRILNQNLTLQENQIILKRFLDFNEVKTDVSLNDRSDRIMDFDIETINLNAINFKYSNNLILDGLSFSIKKGEKIKFEGENGSGKSTFCKILTSMIFPDSGTFLVNDNKLDYYDPQAYRQKIILSTNEDIVFNDTILENITFGRKIPLETILDLSKKIGFYDFLSKAKSGVNFEIQGNGKNLSTGQRKKILLLRAFLSSAEILIFDEVLSGIDIESRKKIEYYINENSKAIIIISHEPIEHINFSKKYFLIDGKLNII